MAYKALLSIDQGTTFNTTITLSDQDNLPLYLAGYTAVSQIKEWYTSNIVYNFVASIANNVVSLALDANTTGSMPGGKYLYDVLVIDSSNNIARVIEGTIFVNPGITNQLANVNL